VRALSLFFFFLQFCGFVWGSSGPFLVVLVVRFCSLAETGFRGISALRFWVRNEVELEGVLFDSFCTGF
jgi:hypothetical protein